MITPQALSWGSFHKAAAAAPITRRTLIFSASSLPHQPSHNCSARTSISPAYIPRAGTQLVIVDVVVKAKHGNVVHHLRCPPSPLR